MKLTLLPFGALCLALASAQSLPERLQPLVDQVAAKYNCSMAMGVHMSDGTRLALAGGVTDGKTRKTEVSDRFIWGSVTKMVTGSSILRLVQEGKIALTDKASQFADPQIAAQAKLDPTQKFSSLADLFGPEVNNVTVEHLARMQSGIPDYDTAKPDGDPPTDTFRSTVYANPTHDYSPFDLISSPWICKQTLLFPPGSKTSYSSTNFVILGLILAEVNGTNWKDFNQNTAILNNRYPSTVFAVTGAPNDFSKLNGFDRTNYNGQDPSNLPGIDVSAVHGVFGGWTASDYVANVQDTADFGYDLYGKGDGGLIEPALVDIMVPSSSREFYAFATFNLARNTGQSPPIVGKDYSKAYGHLGATYGYDSVVVYTPTLNMSVAIASNIETETQAQPAELYCLVYNAIKDFVLKDPMSNCSFQTGSYFGKCVCAK